MTGEKGGTKWTDLLLVMSLGLLVNCWFLGSGPLAGTEGHRAIVGHQMAMGGNWLLPKLYDQVYLAKPPLDYWILAGMEKLTGHGNEWVWRLPSAIAGSAMAVFLCWIGGRWFGRLGGITTGIGCCSMISLWGQNHTAEIDALNSLACVVTACLLLDVGYGSPRHHGMSALLTGLAFGAAMLLKGPVGLTGIGAALIGPAIFNRTTRTLKQPWPWMALAIGGGMFAAYAVAALHEFRTLGLPVDTSGVNEIWINLWNSDRIRYLIPTLFLPVILLVYAMPVSFFFPMALYAPLWCAGPAADKRFSDRERQLLRALVGTLVAACVITILCGFSFPRYSYSWLPLICPVAGAVVEAWRREIFPRRITDWLHVALAGVGIAFAVGMLVMAILCGKEHVGNAVLLFGVAALAVILSIAIIRWILRDNRILAVTGVVATILLAGPLFGMAQEADRIHRSAAQLAAIVRGKVPAGETVTTGHLLLDQPELFYYAGVNVESHPFSMFVPRDFPTSRWLLLDAVEYDAWQKQVPGRLTDVQFMKNQFFSVILARYEVSGVSTSAESQ